MYLQSYNAKKVFYLEMDSSNIDLGDGLPEICNGMTESNQYVLDNCMMRYTAFASKSLSTVETTYSNIERRAFAILAGLNKFDHYLCRFLIRLFA